MIYHHPREDPLRGLTLPGPRTREIGSVDLWRFIPTKIVECSPTPDFATGEDDQSE